MNIQDKTTAIKTIVANHQDNVTAVRNAQVGPGLDQVLVDAMNTALKTDLLTIFCLVKPAGSGAG
jgi:hypothetical protein